MKYLSRREERGYEFLKLRLADEKFNKAVEKIREKWNINAQYLSSEDPEAEDEWWSLIENEELADDVEKMLRENGYSIGWAEFTHQYVIDNYDKDVEIEEFGDADENYHITAKTVLSLAQRAAELFESSELAEKQQIFRLVFQNPKVRGKKLEFSIQKPFDTIVDVKGLPVGLHGQDSNLQPTR